MDSQTLNYKYRLCPTDAQSHALKRSMRLIRWGWNLAVRRERWARKLIRMGREADLHNYLARRDIKLAGRRAAKLKILMAEGLTTEHAKRRLARQQTAAAWRRTGSGLSVEYSAAAVDDAKQSMIGKTLGSAWAKLTSDKGKFQVAWKACWEDKRGAPRKNKDACHGWLAMQIQGQNPILAATPNQRGDNYVNLGALMFGRADSQVRFLHHRPLPAGAKITELKVTRDRDIWHVVFTICADVPKEYPATGRSCGIDPGMVTPVTVAGDDMEPGIDGWDRGPGRPLTKSLKKLSRLLRHLDRQRRANNPACYRPDGTWIKGAQLTVVSKGMRETEARIAQIYAHCASIRKDTWNKTADEIFYRYDTVYLGNWQDGTPASKGAAKAKRKEAYAKRQEKRAKGQAAQQRTRERINRDNGLGVFRQILFEKAKRSATAKQVIVVNEVYTTQTCCGCGALEGPAGQDSLRKRDWTCPQCGHAQKRDRGAAWNILQAGMRQAGGQPVTEGRDVTPRSRERKGRSRLCCRNQADTASSQAGAFPGEALASASITVSHHGVRDAPAQQWERGTGQQQRPGPQPLAYGTVSTTIRAP